MDLLRVWQVTYRCETLNSQIDSGQTRTPSQYVLNTLIKTMLKMTTHCRLGLHFGLITASDLILVDESGTAVGGNTSRPANAAGFLIHSAIHKKRPEVNAACHFHSTYGKAWSAFAQPLEMLNQDVAIFYGDAQSVYEDFGGVVLKEEESNALAKSLGNGKGMILRNHGLLTVGGTIDEAAYLFLLMEKSCQVQLAADAAVAAGRKKVYIDDEAARFTYENTSDPVSLSEKH
jgi:ribulose-5-phosphate 4-epimerase/fuculose-1-phosphate aldolase